MIKETSLIFLTKAEEMLIKASTIQEVKEFKDIALTAKDWAERKGLGEKAIREANSYVLRAERKLGEMLKATERAKAGRPKIGILGEPISDIPTLSELGITKKESSEAQIIGEEP